MNWQEIDNKLVRECTFPTFADAIRFVDAVAHIAEEMQHHPHIENIYTSVILKLSTHDADNTITDKDRELANRIDMLL